MLMAGLNHRWYCNYVPGKNLTLPAKNSMMQTLVKTPRILHCYYYKSRISHPEVGIRHVSGANKYRY